MVPHTLRKCPDLLNFLITFVMRGSMEVGPGLGQRFAHWHQGKKKSNSRTCHLVGAIDGDHSAHLCGATLL